MRSREWVTDRGDADQCGSMRSREPMRDQGDVSQCGSMKSREPMRDVPRSNAYNVHVTQRQRLRMREVHVDIVRSFSCSSSLTHAGSRLFGPSSIRGSSLIHIGPRLFGPSLSVRCSSLTHTPASARSPISSRRLLVDPHWC